MNAAFYLRKGILIQGLVCAAGFLVAVALYGSLLFLADAKLFGFWNQDAALALGWIGIALFGTMFVLSTWVIAAYFIETISFDGTAIAIRSVSQNKRFDLSELRQLVWNCRPRGGKLTFRTTTSKAVLHLYGFAPHDQLEIISIARKLVPESVQSGWDEFCHFVALPLREGRSSRQPGGARIDPASLPESARVHVSRGRYDRFFLVLLVISVCVSGALWQILAMPEAIELPFVVLFFWGLLRFSTPKKGSWSLKWSATNEMKNLVCALLVMPIMCIAMIVFRIVGLNAEIPMWAGLVIMVALMANGVRHARKREKEQRARDQHELPSSIDRWNAKEATR